MISIFYLGLWSAFFACGEKSTDTATSTLDDTGTVEDTSVAEPSDPPIEPSDPPEPTDPPVQEDEDGDGFSREDGDCDDNNPDVYPGAEDVPGNDIDEDCSGSDAELTGRPLEEVLTGELIITEVMNNPSAVADDVGEWIEIFNNSDSAVNLNGIELSDTADDFYVLDQQYTLPSREHVVLGLSTDPLFNGGVEAVTLQYNGIVLSNSADEVILSYNGRLLDDVHYSVETGFAQVAGKSMSLHVDKYDFTDNDLAENWCPSGAPFGSGGDYATPGQMNGLCPVVEDADGDGFNNQIDCDDTNSAINPTATETWYNGVDENCNGDDDYDQDGDGYASAVHQMGGQDCDDTNAFINPDAYDVPENGIDENCDENDGASTGIATVADLTDADLVINEIMYNPATVADSVGEWFEIYVEYAGTVNLGGLSVCDNQGCTSINTSLEVSFGDYIVLGIESDPLLNGGLDLDYAYGTGLAGLGNSGDRLELSYNGTIIDLVDFSSAFPNVNGSSMELDPGNRTGAANDEYFNWCAATQPFGSGDQGTPGAENGSCN